MIQPHRMDPTPHDLSPYAGAMAHLVGASLVAIDDPTTKQGDAVTQMATDGEEGVAPEETETVRLPQQRGRVARRPPAVQRTVWRGPQWRDTVDAVSSIVT